MVGCWFGIMGVKLHPQRETLKLKFGKVQGEKKLRYEKVFCCNSALCLTVTRPDFRTKLRIKLNQKASLNETFLPTTVLSESRNFIHSY